MLTINTLGRILLYRYQIRGLTESLLIYVIKEIGWIADRGLSLCVKACWGGTCLSWCDDEETRIEWGGDSWQRGSWVMDHFHNLCLRSREGGRAGTFFLDYQEGAPLKQTPHIAIVLLHCTPLFNYTSHLLYIVCIKWDLTLTCCVWTSYKLNMLWLLQLVGFYDWIMCNF